MKFISFIGFSSNIAHYKQRRCKFWFYCPTCDVEKNYKGVIINLNSTCFYCYLWPKKNDLKKERPEKIFFLEFVRRHGPEFRNGSKISGSNSPRLSPPFFFPPPKQWIDLRPRSRFQSSKTILQSGKITVGVDNWFYKFRFDSKCFPSVCKSSAFEER